MTTWHDADKSSTFEDCRGKPQLNTVLSHWRRFTSLERPWSYRVFSECGLPLSTVPCMDTLWLWGLNDKVDAVSPSRSSELTVMTAQCNQPPKFCASTELLQLHGKGDN